MGHLTWFEWTQNQWMANRDEREAWRVPPISREQYVNENLSWLTRAYAEHLRLSQVAQGSSQTNKTT